MFYELAPGEQFSGVLHTHHDQEEIFHVLDGTATFDVGTDRETVEVDAGQVVRFPPGEFQSGRNETDDPVRALVVAAPDDRHTWADIECRLPCPDCGEVTSHGVREPDESGMTVYCEDCGHELS